MQSSSASDDIDFPPDRSSPPAPPPPPQCTGGWSAGRSAADERTTSPTGNAAAAAAAAAATDDDGGEREDDGRVGREKGGSPLEPATIVSKHDGLPEKTQVDDDDNSSPCECCVKLSTVEWPGLAPRRLVSFGTNYETNINRQFD